MATGFTNECDVITIFPLGVTCFVTNPTNNNTSNGSVYLLITGGTPPYKVTWSNGNTSFLIQNLPVGNYSATIVDYWGDFTASTTCTLTSENPLSIPIIDFVEEEIVEKIMTSVIPLSVDTEPPLSLDYSVNHPICGCDGNIVLIAENGYPPYTFSINGNLTTKNFPFFDQLCSGNYYLNVNDSSGNTATNFVVLNEPSDPTTYTLQLNTFSSIVQNSVNQKVVSYTNTFSIFPTLPNGVTITFDLSHSSNLESSPNFSSATLSTTSVFSKNGSGLTPSITAVTTGTGVNLVVGCQNETIYLQSIGEIWSQISISSTDTITLSTQSTLTKIDDVVCYFGDFSDSFSINNVSISGCGCCNVITTQ